MDSNRNGNGTTGFYPDAKSKDSLEDGLRFQDFVCSELARRNIILQNLSSKKYQFTVGENLQGFEIKYDDWCSKSGRISIEVFEKTRNDPIQEWTPSGILRNDNSWLYVQGNYSILFVFAKRFLLNYYTAKGQHGVIEKRGTIKTFYISNDDARRHAALVLEF